MKFLHKNLMHYTLIQQIGSKDGVEVFCSITSFKDLYFGLELGLIDVVEIFKEVSRFKFFFHKEYPCKSSVIINEIDDPSRASDILTLDVPQMSLCIVENCWDDLYG